MPEVREWKSAREILKKRMERRKAKQAIGQEVIQEQTEGVAAEGGVDVEEELGVGWQDREIDVSSKSRDSNDQKPN